VDLEDAFVRIMHEGDEQPAPALQPEEISS
ncbi:ABC transporter ATP-binding protein, partial [Achromobacter xylosoxidans]